MQENRSSYKIYSRNRLNIFKGKRNFYEHNGEKNKKIIIYLIIILIAIFTLCEEKAHEIATIVTNEESTKVMSNYKYGDMFSTEKDENRKYKND